MTTYSEVGHFRRECPKSYQQTSKFKHSARPVTTESDSEQEGAFGAFSQSYGPRGWIVDSGASSHMTQMRDWLVDYEEFDKPQKVCLGDGRIVEASGMGNIHFNMVFEVNKPKKVVMYNALYVPELTCNLFSVREAATKGNIVKFGDVRCWIRDKNGKLLGIGSLVDKLYYLDCNVVSPDHVAVGMKSQAQNTTDLWHRRLGHLNEQQLKEMVNKGLVKGVEISKCGTLSFCEKCVEGKMFRKPFKSVGEIRSTNRLQCVHTDVSGPMPTESIGGKRYFVTFIDDYSRACKVYFIKNKSEVFNKFKAFEMCTTNECGNSIRTLESAIRQWRRISLQRV